MIPDTPNPASAAARTGSGDDVCFGGEQFPDTATAQKYQAQNLVRADRARMLAEFDASLVAVAEAFL